MDLSREQIIDILRTKPRHERIVLLRSLYDLSQTGLAQIASVNRGTVSTWESALPVGTGRGHEPGKIARSRMGAYFNLPPYVFTDEWGNPDVARRRPRRKSRPPVRKQGDASLTVPPSPIKRIG